MATEGTKREVAVVLGASVTGLMAAAALRSAYEKVILIERDALVLDGLTEARKGVGQGRHNHNLTAFASHSIERLFPGVLDELRDQGATVCDVGRDGRWYLGGVRMPRVEVGHPQVLASRPLLDRTLLARLLETGQVQLHDATDVCGLVHDEGAIRGVRTISRRDGQEKSYTANVVVDASGRGSRTPRWLRELGYPAPEEDHVEVSVSYATRVFRRRPTDLDGDRFVYVASVAPDRPRGAVAFAVEGERWMVLQFSYGAPSPTALEAFRKFGLSLGAPELTHLLERCEPLGDAATYAFPRSTRRRYDRARMPRGLVVIGDALQSTNPSWGLGITSAALHIETLERSLTTFADESEGFHRAAIARSEAIWGPVRDRDLAFDVVPGAASLGARSIARLVQGMFLAAASTPALAKIVLEVVTHVRSPLTLLRPDRILRAVIAANRAAPSRRAPLASAASSAEVS